MGLRRVRRYSGTRETAPLISLFARPSPPLAAKGEKAAGLEGTMPQLTNPILPGFNPDPSIVRVGDDYYIATSTFEWYPGVQIHHSRDLANWDAADAPADAQEPARHARRSGLLRHLGALPQP